MNGASGLGTHKILQRMAVRIIFALIDFTGGHAVTKHLGYIAHRHGNRLVFVTYDVIVRPVFKVVSIPTLVVEPCGRIAVKLTFLLVGAFVAAVKPCTGDELGGAVLRKIVPKSLPQYAGAAAVGNDLMTMPRNCSEMSANLF